jgi:hypothetical protein
MHAVSAAAQSPADSSLAARRPDSLRTYILSPIRVEGRMDDLVGFATSASQGRVGRSDLALRPLLREAELLETLPGMIVTQHSGEGKSNQMFLRGFNLDHGTDFRTEVDCMPVNLPTHGHGHGYTDLNFLIPELVDHIEFHKGVYEARIGDFGSAGGAHFHLAKDLAQSFLEFEAGAHGHTRAVGAAGHALGKGTLLLAGETRFYDGVWDLPGEVAKYGGLARYTWKRDLSEYSILALGYHNDWHSSDQLPLRAANGPTGRFGQVDSTLGGDTGRYSLSASWRRQARNDFQRAAIYGIAYDLDLFSNFTYGLGDSLDGDQFEQVDKRMVFGGSFEHNRFSKFMGRDHLWSIGLQTRTDVISEVGLHRTRARRRVATVRDDEVLESTAGLFVQARSTWHPRVHSVLGLRGDQYFFDVESSNPENSGDESAGRVSPKATLVFGPWRNTELYANAGLGFHSNDARGTTIRVDPASGDPASTVDPLVPSRGLEVGVRINPVGTLRSTVALWQLDLDSELLFVGDAGTTEPSGRSQRIGIEFANFWRPRTWLSLDADVSLSRGRLLDVPDDEDRIPGALEHVVAAGLAAAHPSGVDGALRVRYLGEYPLIETNAVRADATTLVNASLGYRFRRIRVGMSVLNLFDSDGNDIQYFYASRLPGEPTAGIEDVHVHPFEPRQLRGSVTWRF